MFQWPEYFERKVPSVSSLHIWLSIIKTQLCLWNTSHWSIPSTILGTSVNSTWIHYSSVNFITFFYLRSLSGLKGSILIKTVYIHYPLSNKTDFVFLFFFLTTLNSYLSFSPTSRMYRKVKVPLLISSQLDPFFYNTKFENSNKTGEKFGPLVTTESNL